MRKVVLVVVLLGSLLVASSADAAPIPSVFGGDVPCTPFDNGTPDPADDQQRCGENGRNEVQTVTIDATGGTFRLVFFGQPTAPIAFNAPPDAVDSALEALPQTSVAVTGGAGAPYTITFTGVLAKTDVDELVGDATGLTGGAMTATVVTDTDGVPPSTTVTWDGMPIDVNVAFPSPSTSGPYPLLIWGHGYAGSKLGFSAMKRFTDRGYAVFSMTDRGFHESCGTPASKAKAPAACAAGWVRLMDTRYEVRDAQEFAAELADEDVVDPQRIGALGDSYGGGLSMALAALKDRKMMPDDSLVPWVSPVDAEPMRIAGAVPSVPWTDLAYALVPNGSTLDYVTDAPYAGRFGVMKQSYVTGLYLSGQVAGEGFYAPIGTPSADLTGWNALLDAGEPYDGNPDAAEMLADITTHHSSYYIDHSQTPAPLLISSGFTDDLVPADEAIRFYNRTRTEFPSTPIKLFFGDFGHSRAANKADVSQALQARQDAWLDFYVKGTGAAPAQGVETFTQTCPNTAGTPSGGPFTAGNWAQLPLGEVVLGDAGAKTIAPAVSDVAAAALDPIGGGGNPCRTVPAGDQAGTATYRLPAAAGNGYTLMGSATVIADISSPTANSQLAARLLDVDPGTGQATLVSRAVLRPAVGSAKQAFQLHSNGWRFAPGHVAKLELLPADSTGTPLGSYARASNGQGDVTVSNLELRLPVLEKPGAAGGAVRVQRDKFVPAGYTLTADAAAIANDANATIAAGKFKGSRKFLKVPVGSPAQWEACHATIEVVRGGAATAAAKGKKGKAPLLIASGSATVPGGTTGVAKLKLTKKARKRLAGRKFKVTVRLVTAEQDGTVTATGTAVLAKRKK